ncbi:MAG: alpha-amylase family protein [Lentisphaeria bacterium]
MPNDDNKDNKWFTKSFRRLLVDMHIPDWNEEFLSCFSPENYADMMQLANVDTAEIYAGSCLGLCYWPTKVGFPHRQLHGRDLLGETISACQKRNIKVQIYLNVWSRAAYDKHPEWRLILHDGQGTVEHYKWRFGLCCFNTPFRQYFLQMLAELNENYNCVGFWIDMIGHWYYCFCPSCQKRFQQETGYDTLPRNVDWNNPAWLALQECRKKWLDEFATQIQDVVKKQHPERTVTLQTTSMIRGKISGIGAGFLAASDFLAGDFVGDRWEQSDICKLYSACSRHKPIEFMTPRCVNLSHHTTERPLADLMMRAYAAIANQASFTLIDAIDPKGSMDRRFYEHARIVFSTYEKYEKYLRAESIPLTDLAIYHAPESLFDLEQKTISVSEFEAKLPIDFVATRRNLIAAIQEDHLLFSFITSKDLENLQRHPLIVLSDCACLTDAECEALEKYVASGGRIYASMHSSLYDDQKGWQADFKLAKLFGVHYSGKKTDAVTYIAPTSGTLLPNVSKMYPLMLNGKQLLITAGVDTEILGTLTLPCSGPNEQQFFGSAISNPPMHATDYPAMTRHRYGKGEVLYAAGKLEEVPFKFHRQILGNLFRTLCRSSVIETNAPSTLEVTVFDQTTEKRLIICLLNLPSDLPPVPLHALNFRLRLPNGYQYMDAYIAPLENPLKVQTMKDGRLEFFIQQLNEFLLITLNYKKNTEG